jgi:CRP/FNR family cyclic AMP-dependent transcriptional regulator
MLKADLRQVSLFSHLGQPELDSLRSRLVSRIYHRGSTIFHQGDPSGRLFIIESGWVKLLRQTEAGDEMLIEIFGPGSVFGELSIFTNEPRTGTVTTIEETRTVSLSRAAYYELVSTHPRIALRSLELLARRIRASDELIQDLAFLDVPGRLAKRLIELAAQTGADIPEGRLITLRISQDDLATMVGTTRESVNKSLAMFRRKGAISRRGNNLVIVDEAALRSRIY